MTRWLVAGLLFLTFAGSSVAAQTKLVVAADGSGQFRTVQEAVNAVPQTTRHDNPAIIFVKPGIYKELIYVQHEKRFVHLVGENAEKTVLTFDLHANVVGKDGKPIGTFRTPSTVIDADDFTAENITFENSAGPVGQALAIRVDGDRAVFRNCRFLGWQDTILLNHGRQYFENCYINGHVDFIFGGATAFFERCHIHCLKDGYITAASTPFEQPFGFVFSNCKITGESPAVKTYLGRPWRPYASVVFLHTEMSDVVLPAGWHNWNAPEREKTARYAEFASSGRGANQRARVPWAQQLTKTKAKGITLKKVLGGFDGWEPKRSEVRGQGSEVRGQRSEVRGQRSEVRGQGSEVRGQRSGVRGQRSEVRSQRSGQKSEVRSQRSAFRNSEVRGQRSEIRSQTSVRSSESRTAQPATGL